MLRAREALEEARGQAPSLSLDLHDQWTAMEKNGQWRFTPPTHIIAALDRALDQHAAEGGVAGRGARYRRNCALLVEGLRAMGFQTLLPDRKIAALGEPFDRRAVDYVAAWKHPPGSLAWPTSAAAE